ncbi:hypothetical protein [Nonomuraea sp. NPDC005650]|uniref:hypothetical protein n=1 Tax=Nonomuraea sp. NPDC005650 TaxID=3157045 RepID=UPI0033B8FDD7
MSIDAGRLTLRPFGPQDIPWVFEVSQDPAVQRFVQVPCPYLMEGTLRKRLVHRGERVDAWVGSLLRQECAG